MENGPIQIEATALRPVLMQLLTKLLALAGAGLVAHGVYSQDQMNALVPEVAGTLLTVGATAWAAWRSKRNYERIKAVEPAVSDAILTVKGK